MPHIHAHADLESLDFNDLVEWIKIECDNIKVSKDYMRVAIMAYLNIKNIEDKDDRIYSKILAILLETNIITNTGYGEDDRTWIINAG